MRPIEIENLTKVYRDRRREVLALDAVSFTVEAGEVIGFLGPNGAGKSTLIKTLVGLIQPTAGLARLFGRPATDPGSRRNLGFLPENPSFYDFLSAREYLQMVGSLFGMPADAVVRESSLVLDRLDLRSAEQRPIRTYSKGMVQRLGLAQTLLHDPDLYILDEPMSGLDPHGRALVKTILQELKGRGKTVFFSTHVTADVEAVCDRVAIIASGKLQSINAVRDLLEQGIEGYTVQMAGCLLQADHGFALRERPGGIQEVYVPKEELSRFMAVVARYPGQVQLIETRRRDLEKFFLDIVKSDSA